MKILNFIFLISIIISGFTKANQVKTFDTKVTFPVNDQCHDYVTQLSLDSKLFRMSYKPFTIKLDAFPQISGFMELHSDKMLQIELNNEAHRIIDDCFARAKTSIDVSAPEGWLNVQQDVQMMQVNGVPIHSLVLEGSKLNIYFNWNDREFK